MNNYENIELINRIMQTEQQLNVMFSTFYSEILDNYNKVAGDILSNADLQKLKSQGRPDYMYNLYRPFVNSVLGNFKNIMPSVDFLPKTPDDQQYVNTLKGVNDFLFYQANNLEYEVAKAFCSMLIGRIGWLVQDFCYSDDYPEGYPKLRFYDMFKIKFDPSTTRRDLSDCNYISDSSFMSPEDIVRVYARNNEELENIIIEKSKTILGLTTDEKRKNSLITWAERILQSIGIDYKGEKRGFDTDNSSMRDWTDQKNGTFKVIDYYERRWVKTMKIFDYATGQTVDVTNAVKADDTATIAKDYTNTKWYDNEKLQVLKQSFIQPEITVHDVEQIYQSSVCPALNISLYDAPADLQNGNFKFTPIFGYDQHPDILETKCLIDDIKDSIRSANLRRNTMLTYLMRASHGGYIAEESALKELKEEFVRSLGVPGSVSLVKDGTLQRGTIQQKQVAQFPASLDRFASEELENAQFISGVNNNNMGRPDTSKESGILYNARVEQGNLMQEPINDNAQSALQILAKNNIAFIRKYWKEPMVIRILEDKTRPYWVYLNQRTISGVLNDVSKGKYDVILSATPFGKQAKEREFQKLLMLNQQLAQVNPAYVDIRAVIKASGSPYIDEMLARIDMIDGQMAQITDQALLMKEQQMQGQMGVQAQQAPQQQNDDQSQIINSVMGV